jgi:protease I
VTLTDKKVLLLAADLFEDMELLYPLYRLAEEGVAVTTAGTDQNPVTGKKGHGPLQVDTTVDRLSADDFDALVGPRRVRTRQAAPFPGCALAGERFP